MGLYLHNIARKRTVEYASLDQNCCFGKNNSLPYSIDGSATKKFILNVEICLLDEANSR
jgi:hypothetical protein